MSAANSILKISIHDLKFGMYVSQLDRPWLDTPYSIQGIMIQSLKDIEELCQYCKFVYVDILKSDAHVIKKCTPGLSGLGIAHPTNSVNRNISHESRTVTNKTSFHGNQIYIDTHTFEEELPAASKIHNIMLDVVKELGSNYERYKTIELCDARNMAYAMRDSIVRNPDAMLLLAKLKSSGNELYDNAVHHSILLLAFGRHLGLPREELSMLGLGGLLMDIGKLQISSEITSKKGLLKGEEYILLKKHVTFSEEIIKQSGDIPQAVLEITAQHHEREDGSGYPRGLNASQLNTYARMAAIVDYYLELATSHPGLPSTSAFRVFNQLKESSRYGLNATLVEQFAHCIGVFPVGSLVELNSGEVAIVLTHSRSSRSLPTIMVVLDAHKKPYEVPETRDLKQLNPGPDGIPYTIVRDLPFGAYGIDVKNNYL